MLFILFIYIAPNVKRDFTITMINRPAGKSILLFHVSRAVQIVVKISAQECHYPLQLVSSQTPQQTRAAWRSAAVINPLFCWATQHIETQSSSYSYNMYHSMVITITASTAILGNRSLLTTLDFWSTFISKLCLSWKDIRSHCTWNSNCKQPRMKISWCL